LFGWSPGGTALGIALAALVAAGVPVAALAHPRAIPRVVGSAKAGKPLFQNTCGVCHRLRAASTTGAAGPDLGRVVLSQGVIIKAITNGGATVMTKLQVARYTTEMTPYRNVLTTTQIQDIAAFVYNATHVTK
jgi:mono/diheme cytochrome c family protein